eukprot:scaffold531_cov30-Attheya_sp.AAC.2
MLAPPSICILTTLLELHGIKHTRIIGEKWDTAARSLCIHGGDLGGINFHGNSIETPRKYLMLGLTGALGATFDCLSTYLAAGGAVLVHDLSGSNGVSPCLALYC